MRRQLPPHNGSICQICELHSLAVVAAPIKRQSRLSFLARYGFHPQQSRPLAIVPTSFNRSRLSASHARTFISSAHATTSPAEALNRPPETKQTRDLGELVQSVNSLRQQIVKIPRNEFVEEGSVVNALSNLEATGGSVVDAASLPPSPTASALLDLDDSPATATTTTTRSSHLVDNARRSSIPGPYMDAINLISDTAYRIIDHPGVFISPAVLDKYVGVHSRLGLPETIPYAFELYANKPMPRPSRKGVKYVNQNPNSHKNAVPQPLADRALYTAISAKNLDAAVGIIQASFDTPAFRRSKLFRKVLVPGAFVTVAPVAIYDISSSLAAFQNTMDQGKATFVVFGGILAYVVFTGSLGMIARMTENDQMKRVTWAPGVPLRHRWIHEEQRAAYDRVACAWGFKEPYRSGEETGEEWELLREYIGQKGMILDAVELMEGMQ
ncbi:hypothetical protein MKZ38_005653 [Zalerion maritima]|uniref:Uncharacterized protein n=1 Tax=Zalerion maritima TaxID=339359 RepID=A0AAD5WUQ7_9PEZI|nr:hypothetical protein MKZ38_005653 [Zalerion maritima]